ncbi:hypothetical protein SAY87_023787 [Trapa incisa]|uniref:Pectinesterase inhibitor domain-containing protein n=1 Tax=Trapa incisa TaxID=236973 RepID=A0AAN7KZ65_9MYRT|nr:hypothetical protein SAY87_023787 [Trapa incisa]
MASPVKSYVSYCYFLIALLLDPLSLTTAADFSSPICSGTLDPTRCFEVIKTITGAGQAASLSRWLELLSAFPSPRAIKFTPTCSPSLHQPITLS